MATDNNTAIKNFSAALALLGVRLPEAPQYPSIVEGPFVAYASVNTAVAASGFNMFDALSADRKLYSVGFTGAGARPTGLLWLDAVGATIVPRVAAGVSADDAAIAAFANNWSVTHQPQGGTRQRVMAASHFAAVQGQSLSAQAAPERAGNGSPQVVPELTSFCGGSWKINAQGDTFRFEAPQILAASPITLTQPLDIAFRFRGVFITQSYATDLGLLDSTGNVCVPDASQIASILASRKDLGQSSY